MRILPYLRRVRIVGSRFDVPDGVRFLKKLRIFSKIVRYIRYMSIHNIIPGNIRETLTTEGMNTVFLGKSKTNSVESFSNVHGEVLSSMKSLSAKRYVKVGDTHGKSGFSALGQILSNIGHNIRVLFKGGESKDCKALENVVNDLETFAEDNKVAPQEKEEDLKRLYKAVKSAKYEHIKDNRDNNDFLLLQLAEEMDEERKGLIGQTFDELKAGILKNQKNYNKDALAKSMEEKNFDLDRFVENYGGNFKKDFGENFVKMYNDYCFLKNTSFKDLALRTLSAVPGDKETLWAIHEDYVRLTNLVLGGNVIDSFKGIINARLASEFEYYGPNMEKPKLEFDPKPNTLADRIEVALKKIANNSGISLN